MPLGVREGAFQFLPRIDESFGYTSNALPGPYRRGSCQMVTAPAIVVNSDWSRDAFGAAASVQDTRYVSLPSQDRTDGDVVSGRADRYRRRRADPGGGACGPARGPQRARQRPSDRPIAFQIDDFRASYAMIDGPWSLVPAVQAANWTYGNTTILGVPASQAYRDRLVVQTDVTMHYEFAPLRSVVFVVRAIDQSYRRTPAGQPSLNSTSYQVLAGLDYDDDTIWRWRLLIGGEIREFASPLYHAQNTLIAEAGVGWSPSPMTYRQRDAQPRHRGCGAGGRVRADLFVGAADHRP